MLLVVIENGRNLLDVVNPHQIDKLVAGYCLREQVNNTMRRRLCFSDILAAGSRFNTLYGLET